jgi:hypothetical protein
MAAELPAILLCALTLALQLAGANGGLNGGRNNGGQPDPALPVELSSFLSGFAGLPDDLFVDERDKGLLAEIAGLTGGLVRKWQRRLGSLIPSPAHDIGWTLREMPPPRANATAAFYSALADVQANRHSTALDARYVYVLVPGLLAHCSPGYFRQTIERLRHLGLDARYLGLDGSTDACSKKNAARLRLALTNVHRDVGGRKLVVIAHSKGMLDTILALALFPELSRSIHAIVSLQAPFGGAAIADDIAARGGEMQDILDKMLAKFELGINSVRDMTYDHRRAMLREHGYPLYDTPSIRVVSFASRAPRRPMFALALVYQYILRKHGAENDGLVCVADAFLPGSLAVVMNEADHGLPVLPSLPGQRLKGSDIVEAALTVALMPEDQLPLERWDMQAARDELLPKGEM